MEPELNLELDDIIPEQKYMTSDGTAFKTYEDAAKYELAQRMDIYIQEKYEHFSLDDLLQDEQLCVALAKFHGIKTRVDDPLDKRLAELGLL